MDLFSTCSYRYSFLKSVRFLFGIANFSNTKTLLGLRLPKNPIFINKLKWSVFLLNCKIFLLKFKKKIKYGIFNLLWRKNLTFKLNFKIASKIALPSYIFLENFFQKKEESVKNIFFPKNLFFFSKNIKISPRKVNYTKAMEFNDVSNRLTLRKLIPSLNYFSNHIRENFLRERKDLRKIEMFSIDPVGTVEIDDLLHYRLLKVETFHEIGIHIPDIHAILTKSKEFIVHIKENNNYKFFSNKKLNLFPKIISKNFLSLNQNIDRLTFSSIFLFTHDCKIKNIIFSRSIVRNKRCFDGIRISKNIKDFKDESNKKNKTCIFTKKLILIKNICLRLKSLRLKLRGNSKILSRIKISFRKKKLIFWNYLNEELAILFNITIAEKTLQFFPNCTHLRKAKNLRFGDFLDIFQISICFSLKLNFSKFRKSQKNLQLFFYLKKKTDLVFRSNIKFYENIFNRNILFYCFKNRSKSNINTINWSSLYLQATSPIRRFDDLINQQTVSKIIFKK